MLEQDKVLYIGWINTAILVEISWCIKNPYLKNVLEAIFQSSLEQVKNRPGVICHQENRRER
jgi:hypothetical protein